MSTTSCQTPRPMYCFSEIFSYFQRWFEIYLTSSLHFIVEAATPATGTTITWLDRGDNLLSLLRKQKVSVTYDFGIRSFMRPSLILKTWLEFFTSGSLLDHLSMHFNKRSLRWTCNYNLLQDKIIVTQDINQCAFLSIGLLLIIMWIWDAVFK